MRGDLPPTELSMIPARLWYNKTDVLQTIVQLHILRAAPALAGWMLLCPAAQPCPRRSSVAGLPERSWRRRADGDERRAYRCGRPTSGAYASD